MSRLPVSPAASHQQGDVNCIGLDIAWFGGSDKNRDSQFDFIAAVHTHVEAIPIPSYQYWYTRVPLDNRDCEATDLLAAIDKLLQGMPENGQTILALDAPIQAVERPNLPGRAALPGKGELKRRACEDHLSKLRQCIDRTAGGSSGWHPNILPGAPLPPRVSALLAGLEERGFVLWTRENQDVPQLVIECFPAEAIWAMKRLGNFPAVIVASCAKAYKKQERVLLTRDQVARLVHEVLDAFASASGNPALWPELVQGVIDWMLDDPAWLTNGHYRGGKLLDDVVDSMISLAVSLSYVHRCAHVWQDRQNSEDGHIIGPGLPSDDCRWSAAYIDHSVRDEA